MAPPPVMGGRTCPTRSTSEGTPRPPQRMNRSLNVATSRAKDAISRRVSCTGRAINPPIPFPTQLSAQLSCRFLSQLSFLLPRGIVRRLARGLFPDPGNCRVCQVTLEHLVHFCTNRALKESADEPAAVHSITPQERVTCEAGTMNAIPITLERNLREAGSGSGTEIPSPLRREGDPAKSAGRVAYMLPPLAFDTTRSHCAPRCAPWSGGAVCGDAQAVICVFPARRESGESAGLEW